MALQKRYLSVLTAVMLLSTSLGVTSSVQPISVAAADSIESSMNWDTLDIAGGGFVSGIIAGDDQMYARTDVGGAYRYDYDKNEWVQLMDFISEADRGFLSVDAMCVDPNDDDTLYLLCGCAYFSDARTVVFRSYDAGETFEEIDVTDLIQVHGNGYGRQCGEAIAVDPDNPDIIYCGGDATSGTSGLIMSKDGGDTWEPVNGYGELGLFDQEINWPTWTEHKVWTTADRYDNAANGVATIMITGGKVYVGTSITGKVNMHVADVGSDDFQPLSEELPTNYFPSRINLDADGNLLITYVAGLMFDGSGGGAYKYNPSTGELKNISPSQNSYGAVFSDPNDANKLVATTCGLWSSQMWGPWTDEQPAVFGDWFYKSTDGGETWVRMAPGNSTVWNGPLEAAYLQDGGHEWIRDKAIHWTGAMVIDPRNPDKVWVTSGNGVFACDNTWDACPAYYFAADGIEEVVALDMCSVPGGNPYSAIGDYDGFEHDPSGAKIHLPSMSKLTDGTASTGAINYCPSNPKVMVRLAEGQSVGYYTTDGGENWIALKSCPQSGAKAAINQLEDGSYRIFISNDGKISYSDDFGSTWSDISLKENMTSDIWISPDPANPQYVYAYGYYYNQYYYYSKPSATIDDARYVLLVSDDYGTTFSETKTICQYDECDNAFRIAYLEEGTFALAAGWYGAYLVTDYGSTVTKMDNVYYCKTMGYGAAEKEGDPYTLYMYGQPTQSDPAGIYRSTDCGKSWVCINENHMYGGTGNGNFLVGDMNTFGTVYMSTVGCGIVQGQLSNGTSQPDETTTTTTTTTTNIETTTTSITTTSAATSDTVPSSASTKESTTISEEESTVLYGDVNLDGRVDITDAVVLNKAIAGTISLNTQASKNADCMHDETLSSTDSLELLKFLVSMLASLPTNPA